MGGRAQNPDTGEWGGRVEVRAPIVVLSAGGIGTPRLLWHAGLAQELGPVGDGLHCHPGIAIIAWSKERIDMWKGATQAAYFHVPDLPELLPHTISLPPEVALSAMGALGPKLEEGLSMLPHLAGLGVMISDKSTGTVRSTRQGRAKIRYHMGKEDLDVLKKGCVVGAEVMLAGGGEWVFVSAQGSPRARSPAEIERFVAELGPKDFTTYAAHPMSSCRMGLDPATSVIDPQGRAHAMPGLHIVDASVFPTSLGVNPQITTLAVATHLAQRILRRAR